MLFHDILSSEDKRERGQVLKMGARYEEDDDIDYPFLRESVRQGQQPVGKQAAQQPVKKQAAAQQPVGKQAVRRQPVKQQSARQQSVRQQRAVKAQPTRQDRNVRQRQAAQARRKRQIRRRKQLLAVLLCLLLVGSVLAVCRLQREQSPTEGQAVSREQSEGWSFSLFGEKIQGIDAGQYEKHPEWTEDFLTISEYSRPGDPLGEVKNIFVHYTANPNTSAAQNRSYFENLKDKHDVPGASAHFIIGIEGEILQIIPLDEMAYAVKGRNEDSISIECCYKAENGQFTQETYDSLISLLAWLTDTYGLDEEDILRHYDCGGKKCPLYYVEHEDAWRILKQDVEEARK